MSRALAFKKQAWEAIDEETPRKYTEEGFLEVFVGQVYFHYKIVRKLGFGSYSTVWLAADLEFSLPNVQY